MYNSGHHHHHHKQGAPVSPDSAAAADVFEQLCTASTFKSVLYHYRLLCDVLRLKPTNFRNFYPKLKSKLRSWKAQAIWSKFDKRSSHKCYNHGKACTNSKVLIIGAGPCGLRTAIEAQLLGAKVVVVEKRDRFSRNNVLHLWPFVINDLKQLGAKKFYGKFCAGAIDHISIRQLQCILLKVALLLGVEIYENVSFEELTEPPEDQNEKIGWRARLSPADHPANQYEFDVLIGADGKRNTLHGFKRKEFRGKLAIAITANFINKRTELEARVQEISGVAFIFNQKFFKELYAATGIDLENIVYYKDETHYFVMTAKKQSLIEKGVILRDLQDTQQLLHPSNVDRNALMEYAREAADFSTSYQLPHLDFAVNHYGKPDVAMFDFTSMFAAENACRMVEKRGHKLLSGLVGDSLLEPFWPTGSGCARGFLSSFDACWMIRSFSSGKMMPLEVLAERESIYRLLAQTTPENLSKDHSSYSLDPASRYPTINLRAVLPFQVRTLFNTDDPVHLEEITNPHLVNNDELPKKRKRRDSFIHPDTLLIWCKKQVALYDSISIENMTTSFKDGRALCAIIHRYRPDLIDFEALRPEDIAQNNQLAYDILERDFGIPPVMTGREMAECEIPDKLSMISYVSQIYDVFRGEIPHIKHPKMDDGEMEIEQSHIQHSTPHVNILKNLTNKTANVSQGTPTSKKRSTLERGTAKRDDGRITCRLMDDAGGQGGKSDTLKKTKKRRSDRVVSPQERQGREEPQRKALVDHKEEFSDKVRDLEAKFTANSSSQASDKKPKDLIRAIGKIEKSDWNMVAIEKKMHEDRFGMEVQKERERVPKWNRDAYDDKADKFQNIERRLRENGEDEETIAKYRDIDASLKRLEMKLREGSTLETGLRGQNKVSNLASQLSSKWERKETEKIPITRQPSRPMVPLPTSGSDLCHFCGNRVYLVERLSAEGKFFHRQCFKCDYCAANLRLGNYIYDREGTYGGKFFCIPHFGLTSRARGVRRKVEDTDSAKENIVPPAASSTPQPKVQVPVIGGGGGATAALLTVTGGAKVGTPTTISPEDRGTTPERVEFENSVVEQSDEEEYLSEDEWTDRNFGASANELDDTDGDEDSDYSDLSDEEVEDEEMEFIEGGGTLTAAETRRLATSKKIEENGIEKLWLLVQDLLSLTSPTEQRHTTLQMLTTLTAAHDRIGAMRHVFYNYISENYQHEDTKPMFDFFREVIADGKQLEYIEEFVGPFLLEWLPGLLASPQAADALSLLVNLVKFNAAYLDEPVVTGYVKQVVVQLHRANGETEALQCLRVLDAVLAYSYLPSPALPTFIIALTRAVNVPQLTAETWKIMRNLLGTHLGNSGLYVLCRLIQSDGDPHMVRGAIFFLTSALWGNNKVSSLNYKPAAVLPTLQQAGNNNHVLVVYEVALSVQKLVSKMSLELHLSSWDLLLDTLSKLFEHAVALEESHEKQTILTVLKDTLDVIEQLIDLQQFGGSLDKFFFLIDLYAHLRPESSVLRLLDHQAQAMDPLRPHWLANLGTLLHQYYRRDPRPNIRTKALAILSDVYNNNRYLYGTDMVRNVVTIQMEGIETERNVGVRTAAVNLLVHIAITQKSSVVPDILNMLEKIVIAPYSSAGDCVQVVRESEAADIIAAVAGLIRIFKKKLWELPSSYAIQAYRILLSCIEHHYRNQTVLEGVSRVRLQIFEMIFEMRANSKYQLGFPRISEKNGQGEEDSSTSLLPQYSPYIVVDHKHGQLLKDAEQEHGDKQLPSGIASEASQEEPEGALSDATPLLAQPKVEVTHLSLTQSAMTVIVAMKKEKDWEVLRMILERVPQVLQNKALILSRDGNDIDYFAAALCALVTEKSLGLPESLHNTPAKFTKSDFQSFVFPVLATLASYHMHLESVIQQKVIKCLELGVLSRCAGPLCVSALTLCVLEMRDSMIKLLREVMINLSKITATVQNAQPILEFLSTLLHLPKVYASFVSDQYMSIFAIAIPYTNPFKFNHYIVSLAYHVIAMWFLKCRLPFRRHFVPFISKNLNMILTNEEAATRRRSASASEQGRGKGDIDMIQFHNDLRETCVDLMARYTFASCAPLPKRGTVAEMLVSGGQSQTWLIGNKLITITTSGCSQRPLRQGLCDKCLQLCNLEKRTPAPETFAASTNLNRRRHRSEFHRTISHEAKHKPQSKDDLHMWSVKRENGDGLTPLVDQGDGVAWSSSNMGEAGDSESSPVDKLVFGSNVGSSSTAPNENKRVEQHLCACWCQGWAEIYIRQPTGNMSWMMRVQNQQTLVASGGELPLHDLSVLFANTPNSQSVDFSGPLFANRRIDSETLEDEKYEQELLSQPFEETRPRAFSGASDRTQDSDPGSQRDSSGWSSGAPSHTSSDPRINSADAGDDTRGSSPLTNTSTSGENPDDPRVPVQRCHSSPEMSEGAVVGGNEVMQQAVDEEDPQTTTSTPPQAVPSDTEHVSAVAKPAKPKPRFEPTIGGGGSVGSTSPPPIPATRVRHTSAYQTKSVGSGGSISPGSTTGGSSNPDADVDDGSPRPMRRGRGHTISDMNPASRKLHSRASNAAKKMSTSKEGKGGISPSFVFLQLYYHGCLGGGSERPLLVPTQQQEIQRAVRVLDLMRPQETHKIGVLYVGPGQTTEQEILRNSFGSLRYMTFLQGLGSVLELSSVSQDEVFLGGLDTKGNDGKLVYIWHDDVMQVVYHIATLMPTKESDPNCTGKKKHIGNNYVTIVYNESGQSYNINTIKGQFNHTIVEVVPADHSTNSVGVLCRPELADFVGGGGDPRLVSDTNLPILVRQLALHADLASMIWESLNRPPHNPYASNWLERLRKIRKIRQTILTSPEGQQSANTLDFTDMIETDKGEKARVGSSANWNPFLT